MKALRSFTIAALLASGCCGALGANPAGAAARGTEPRGSYEGEWRIGSMRAGGRVQIQLQRSWQEGSSRGSWSHSDDIRSGDLEGITPSQWAAPDAPVSFVIDRDAGTFRADGRLKRGQGSGRFVFEPNPTFRAELERRGFRDLSLEDLERLCIQDVSLEWLRGFGRGTHAYSLDELLRLAQHDISGDYVSEMKESGISDAGIEELVRLKINGVEPTYVRELTSGSRRRYTADEIVRLKINGVTAANIREAKARQRGMTVEDMIRLKHQGEL